MLKKLLFFIFTLLVVFSFAAEINIGLLYSFAGKLIYGIEYNTLGIVKNAPNTTSGFSLALLTDFSEYLVSAGGVAKFDNKLDIGLVSLYGMGGMIVPISNFSFENIKAIVRVGAKYYINNIAITTGLFSLYKPDNTKVEGIEIFIGYSF